MLFQNFTKIITLAAVLSLTFGAQAQDVIWEYDFSDGAAAFEADWTQGGTNDGSEPWRWSDDPGLINFGGQPDFGSATASNGYVYFNSDANGNNSHDVTITSPAIDCSMADVVYLTAENQYSFFSPATISIAEVGVSTNGTDFTYYQIHTDVAQNDLSFAVSPIIVELPEAANQPEVYVQFRWQGFFEYTWKIDDVKLVDGDPRPANDMRVNQFHAIAPNADIPASQVGPFGFIADVQNLGNEEQLNATLTITINDGSTDVFTDEITYGMIGVDSVAENVFFPSEFTPAAEPGTEYTGTYSLELDGADGDANPNDNVQQFAFRVTDTLFAKDPGTGLYATQPADDNNYRFGNVYYVPNGNGLTAGSISFWIGNPEDLVGDIVTIFLSKWPGDTNMDFMANEDEYEIIGFASYEVTGDEDGLITQAVKGFAGEDIELEDDMYYIAAIEYNSDTDNFTVVSGDADYLAMNFYQDSVGNKDQYAVALDVSNTGDYSLVGFGLDVIPVVRFSISGDMINNVQQPSLLAEHTLHVFPTVANEVVWAEIALDAPADRLNLSIVSTQGQVISHRTLSNLRTERIQFDVSQLPAGHYFLRLETAEGIRTKYFSVQH